MKSNIVLTVLCFVSIFVVSCSLSSSWDSAITEKQKRYIEDIVRCDSRRNNFEIVTNADEINEFFTDKKTKPIQYIHYNHYNFYESKWGGKKYVIKRRNIIIDKKSDDNGEIYYLPRFDRLTFPGSDCYKLKRERKYL